MTYATDCIGSVVSDKQNSITSNGSNVYIYKNSAFAQQVQNPSSRCLYSVAMNISPVGTASSGLIMEIVPDSGGGGVPSYNPHSGSGYPNSSGLSLIPVTSGTNVINVILPNTNTFWFIVSPNDYNPSAGLTAEYQAWLFNAGGGAVTDFITKISGTGGWTKFSPQSCMQYSTQVQTYAPCIAPVMTMSIV